MNDLPDAKPANDARSKWIGIYVGFLAALLAICSMGGGNAAKDAMRANIDAANTWAFFQAKNIRRAAYSIASDDLQLTLLSNSALPADVRTAIEDKIAAYKATIVQYTSDKKTNEGLDELFTRAKEIERERDVALRRDPYFDVAQALLQIAIVLASVALLAGGNTLLALSGALSVAGTLLMLNGFTLAVKLPMLG